MSKKISCRKDRFLVLTYITNNLLLSDPQSISYPFSSSFQFCSLSVKRTKLTQWNSLITLLSTMSQWPLVSGGPCRELFFFIGYLFTIFQFFFKNLSSTTPKTLVFTVLWLQKLHLYVRKKEPNNFKLNHRGQLSATRNFIE